MRKLSVQPRGVALLTGSFLAASGFLPVLGIATAHADEKTDRRSKQYKTGAAVLGAAAAYFAFKSKKPLPAAAAAAGAYYAYKKGKDLKNQSDRDRYGYYPNGNGDAQYPVEDGRGGYYNGGRNRNNEPATYPDDNDGYSADYGNGEYASNGSYDDNSGTIDGRDAYSRFPDYSARTLASRKHTRRHSKVK